MKKIFKITAALFLFCFIFYAPAFSQAAKEAKELTQCACASTSASPGCLKDLKDLYFKANRYADFIALLKGLCPANQTIQPSLAYYIALSRYSELKYLEESQSWDEYFAKGNDYRQELLDYSQKASQGLLTQDPLALYNKLLAYQFHKDQEDTFAGDALADLMRSVSAYAQSDADIGAIKEVADKLSGYAEKSKANAAYKIYAGKLAASQIQDYRLKSIAADFYKGGNLELAENIYDIYIKRISPALPAEEMAQELEAIARDFVYKDNAPYDTDYAEKIFKKIEEIGGKEVFDEELMYLRGFNLEKAKAYAQAKDIYIDLINRFPRSTHKDELIYKTGLIYTYILRDSKTGRNYFRQLNEKLSLLPYDLASLYQLGLLKQWEGSLSEAKAYYDRLLQKVGDTDPDRLALARERVKEITQGEPLAYNIKIGLDTALKSEYARLDMSKLSLKSSYYQPQKNQELDLSCATSLGPAGCLQVELRYLWSGDLGGANPPVTQSAFKTAYKAAGTELIVLVLVSPEGISERTVDLIDVR
ncbi:MAG: tetratricopeptide repeat protein [Candidatus Omnitrophica bacterium]|nr:tetratricopeptide repeat protein [Candidatus Omnitrophota bacterium]